MLRYMSAIINYYNYACELMREDVILVIAVITGSYTSNLFTTIEVHIVLHTSE